MRDVPILRYSLVSPLFYSSFAISVIYGLNSRFSQVSGGLWDVVLRVQLSGPIFGLVVLPLWLIFLVSGSRMQSRAEVLIRRGSYVTAWWAGVRAASANWLTLSFAWVIGLYVSAIGLSTTPHLLDVDRESEIFFSGLPPILIMIGQIAIETVFALTIAAVIRAFDFFRFSIAAQIIFGVTIFAWLVAGASGALSADEPFSLSRYLQLRFLLANPSAGLLELLVAAATIAAVALVMRVVDRTITMDSSQGWLNLFTLHWVISASLIGIRLSSHASLPLGKSAILALSGNAGSTMDAITWSFIYFGTITALVISRMPSSSELLDLHLLRAGSTSSWVAKIYRREAPIVTLLSITMPIPGVIAFYALGGLGFTFSSETLLILWVLLINVSLHGLMLLTAAIFGLIFTRSSNGALGAVIFVFLLTLLPQVPSTWWPFGAANLARAAFGATSVFFGTASIIIATVLIFSAMAATVAFLRRRRKREILWGR